MSYTPPTQLHAIGLEALAMYEAAGDELGDEHCAALRVKLEALHGRFEELLDAVHSLGALMLHAERQGKTATRDRLVALIKVTKPYFQARNERVKEGISDRALESSRKLSTLTGARAPRVAPAHGAARPAGAVSLAALTPPSRRLSAR